MFCQGQIIGEFSKNVGLITDSTGHILREQSVGLSSPPDMRSKKEQRTSEFGTLKRAERAVGFNYLQKELESTC